MKEWQFQPLFCFFIYSTHPHSPIQRPELLARPEIVAAVPVPHGRSEDILLVHIVEIDRDSQHGVECDHVRADEAEGITVVVRPDERHVLEGGHIVRCPVCLRPGGIGAVGNMVGDHVGQIDGLAFDDRAGEHVADDIVPVGGHRDASRCPVVARKPVTEEVFENRRAVAGARDCGVHELVLQFPAGADCLRDFADVDLVV